MRIKLFFISLFLVFITGCATKSETQPEEAVVEAASSEQHLEQTEYAAYAERIRVNDATGTEHDLLKRVHFHYNRVFLPYEYRKEVFKHAQFMQEQPDIKVILQGNADIGGRKKVHNKIGFMRAETVKEWLVKYGVEAARISISTYGSDQPLVEGSTIEEWYENRRVDFIYFY